MLLTKPNTLAKKLLLSLSSLAILYGATIIWTSVLEHKYIYQAEKLSYEEYRAFYSEISADSKAGKLTLISLELRDGSIIEGFYMDKGDEMVDLFLHGNAGNIETNRINIDYLLKANLSFLIIDYPGYGASSGSPTEANLYEAARTSYDYLISHFGWRADQIIINGQSLGGAVAIDLASKVPCRSLIVESSFTSTHDMGNIITPWLPLRLLSSNKYNSIEKIDQVKCPVLILHGDQDTMVPLTMAKALFYRAREPKYFVLLSGLGHNDKAPSGDEAYNRKIEEFIRTNQITSP
jgi:pimeloyl-ACP methyl ester carboxylesterase